MTAISSDNDIVVILGYGLDVTLGNDTVMALGNGIDKSN